VAIGAASIKVADECWVALAALAKENPSRKSFTTREILGRIRSEAAHEELRPGLGAHLHQHNIANCPPSTARYRMFYRMEDGSLRLYRSGDTVHPARRGKTNPLRADLPPKFHYLLDWYQNEYCQGVPEPEEVDPILSLRGLGKETWAGIDPDAWVNDLRSGWTEEYGIARDATEPIAARPPGSAVERIWSRILRFQGQEFRTVRKLPYTYTVEGDSGIWFYREGRRIEHRLWRGELEAALKRPSIHKPSDLQMFQCPSYLFGLLTDPRIIGDRRGT
jgi:hypothetical protein